MQRFLAGASLACTILAATSAQAQLDRPPRQVLLDTKFIEVSTEYRNFFKWKDVSGNSPLVTKNDVTSQAYGIDLSLGRKLGTRPLWAQAGGYYDTGLETKTTLQNGDRIVGNVKDFGIGLGLRVLGISATSWAAYAWAMGYLNWNYGDFDCGDEDCDYCNQVICPDRRTHFSVMGDYGVGILYQLKKCLDIEAGLSYNGMFKSSNADENLRLRLGLIWNFQRRRIIIN